MVGCLRNYSAADVECIQFGIVNKGYSFSEIISLFFDLSVPEEGDLIGHSTWSYTVFCKLVFSYQKKSNATFLEGMQIVEGM
jgi:hypothetical protein